MIRFLDGPAAGVVLELARAPLFLRVVRDPQGPWDALDQFGDTPAAGETVTAYRKVSDDGTLHIDGRDKHGKRFGRWLAAARYAVVAVQPDDATLRHTAAWRVWATAQAQAAKPEADA